MKRWLAVSRPEAIAWIAILFVALALRLWGAFFGLPHVYHPDEGFEVYRALRLGMGGFDFERVAKGGYYLLLFLEYGCYFVIRLVTGGITGVSDFARSFIVDPSPFWEIGRVTTAILGTATVLLVGLQARRMGSVPSGLFAAWFLATSFQHVVDSHTITVDVPMTLFTFAALVMIVEDATGRSRLRPWLFGFAAAFAMMNKLPAVMLFVPYFVGAWMRGGVRGPSGLLSRRAWAPVVIAAALYLVGNPGFLVSLKETLALVSHTVGGASERSEEYGEVPLEVNLWGFYARTILDSQGPAVIALAGLGGVLGLVRHRGDVALHLLFIVVFFALIAGTSSSHLYYSRYVLPILPGICVLAGLALEDLVRRVRAPAPVSAGLAGVAALVLVIEPTLASIRWDQRLSRMDTRSLAADWVEAHVPNGARVLLEGFPEETAQLAIPVESSEKNVRAMIERLRSTDPGKATFWEMKLEAISPPAYDLVTVRHYQEWPTFEEVRSQGIEWVVVRREYFVPGARLDTRFKSSTRMSRFEFYEALASAPGAERSVSFDADPAGAPGYDLEIWKLRTNGDEGGS